MIASAKCNVATCVDRADGWGERASAAALTVGLIFWLLFYQEKSNGKLAYHSPENIAAHELGKIAGDRSVLGFGKIGIVIEQVHG